MSKFWELLQSSVIFQGVITVIVLVTVCYMFAVGLEPPGELLSITSVIVGYFFGAKVQNALQKGSK